MLRKAMIWMMLAPAAVMAQQPLSLQEAIGIALQNNYAVRLAGNAAQAARNDNTAGHAGFLPAVSAGGTASEAVSDLNQEYADNRVVDKSGVNASSLSGDVTLTWTLFDGMQMFASKGRYAELAAKGELAVKGQMEQTVQDVIAAYFAVAQVQKLIDALEVNISIDSERVALALARLNTGSGSRPELLQARVDLNEQLSARMRQVALRESSLDLLNYQLAKPPGTAWQLTDSVRITYVVTPELLRSSVMQRNVSVLSAEHDQRISLYSLRETQAQRYPQLDFSTGYTYGHTTTDAGFLLRNTNNGYRYGLTLRWNLFDGMNVNRQVKNARLEVESAGLSLDDIRLRVSSQLENAIRDFRINMEQLALEEENILLARENLDVAFERFRSGLYTSLQLKDAQLSYQEAQSRLVQVQYAAKLSETELMRLNGELVK
jgi:outer membrane protein